MAHVKPFEHLKIELEAIISATNEFAAESCIGGGGFGKVYKGEIAHFDGHKTVALKRLDRKFGQGDPEFWKEVMMLSVYKHENIVSLLGFCDDSGERILVYEYVPNRSLDKYLNSDKLRWIRRLKICIGAARGLMYLHTAAGTQQRVLHRDIKSSNILLDENWNAKISDFGLSKLGPANQNITFLYSVPVGTPGYYDPLYAETGLLTKESDVYSFGVVLFELLCGRLCVDYKNNTQSLVGLARKSYKQNTLNEIVYGNIKDEINPDSLKVFAKMAYQCLKRDREERPSMSDIVTALETALQHQELKSDQAESSYLRPKQVMESDLGKDTRPIARTDEYDTGGGGLLVVTIHQGNDLNGKHPFVMLRIGADFRRTTTMKNNQNPVWRETFKFELEKPAKAILHLAVCSDSWNKKVYPLGDVDISVADVVQQKHMNNRYNIGNGRIHVELQWERSSLPVKTKPKFMQFMSSVYNLALQ